MLFFHFPYDRINGKYLLLLKQNAATYDVRLFTDLAFKGRYGCNFKEDFVFLNIIRIFFARMFPLMGLHVSNFYFCPA